ncbi:hypothetical protein MRS44_015901 [Fusarium solani]|uniref:uncharacterized protein n=1 Tax=Fusarium solani TaxID=169388 RepID=UPI0032C49FA9|nr:hypothetical protein MRS44_015901 [Fusarium solani]
MDDNLSDLVRDSKLRTRYEKPHTIHLFDDPDSPPFSARRREQWKKDRTIGHGGQGRVVLQTCTGGSRGYTQRAVKMIPLQEGGRRRYLRELEAILKFSHDKYAKYFTKTLGWYTSQSKLYIAMEYFPEGDLHSYALKHAPLPENECCEIASQILCGLAAMHQESFAHRDVKPHNILIHQSPQSVPPAPWWVKLADFGITKRLEAVTSGSTRRNGTLLYMAPELFISELSNGSRFDYPAVDMWALGVTTFFILTKSLPFQDLSSVIEYASDDKRSFPGAALVDCKVSMDGQAFIRALIRRQPTERLDSGDAMRHAWNQSLLPETQTAPPHSGSSPFLSRSDSFDEGSGGSLGLTNVNSRLFSKSWSPEVIEDTKSTFETLPSWWREGADDVILRVSLFKPEPIKRYLLAFRVDSETTDPAGCAEFLRAVFRDEERLVKLLLKRGANLESRDEWGDTILSLAAKAGDLSVVRLLIKEGVDVETRNKDGDTALSLASCAGNEAIVKILVEAGASIEPKGDLGGTPLFQAASNGHEGIVALLASMGADLETKNNDGDTALSISSRAGNEAIVKILVKEGANIEAKSCSGETPLLEAAAKGYEGIVKLLASKGAKTDERNRRSETALLIAATAGHTAMARCLLDKGADIEARNHRNHTPLLEAAYRGHKDTVRLFIDSGANLKVSGCTGTALGQAIIAGHESVVKLLLENGFDVEDRSCRCYTPLIGATRKGHEGIVRLLLDKGADIKARNDFGNTPYSVAVNNGFVGIARILSREARRRKRYGR